MNLELIISIVALIASVILGIWQIKLSKEQKAIKTQINNIENNLSQSGSGNSMKGIIGNSNTGNISGNVIK